MTTYNIANMVLKPGIEEQHGISDEKTQHSEIKISKMAKTMMISATELNQASIINFKISFIFSLCPYLYPSSSTG
jgi:hypothetical protein